VKSLDYGIESELDKVDKNIADTDTNNFEKFIKIALI